MSLHTTHATLLSPPAQTNTHKQFKVEKKKRNDALPVSFLLLMSSIQDDLGLLLLREQCQHAVARYEGDCTKPGQVLQCCEHVKP